MDSGLRVLNSFVLDYKKALTDFESRSFVSNMNSVLTEGSTWDLKVASAYADGSIYSQYIAKGTENLNAMRAMDYSYLDKFFSTIYASESLADKNITIALQDVNEIEKIRPEYLALVPQFFDAYSRDIIAGKKKKSDIDKEIVSSVYKEKVKKQLVKTTLVINDTRDLMKLDSPTMVKVNTEFLMNNVIPFIRSFQSDVDFLNRLAARTIAVLGQTRNDMQASIEGLNEVIASGSLDYKTENTVKYFAFNLQRTYMSLSAYLSAMLIRKMGYYSYNMRTIQNLYNAINEFFPDPQAVLHESVMDGNINDIESADLLNSMLNDNLSIILPKIREIINWKKIELSNAAAKIYNIKTNAIDPIDTDSQDYDKTPYLSLKNSILQIADQLHQFELKIRSGDIVMDDVMNELGLNQSFVTRYSEVLNKAKDVSTYDSLVTNHMADEATKELYAEISSFEENCEMICTAARTCMKYIETLQKTYEFNSGKMADPTYQEAIEIMDNLNGAYKDYCLSVARALMDRLDSLSHIMCDSDRGYGDGNDIHPSVIPEAWYDYDYGAFIIEYAQLVEAEKNIFTNLMKEYTSAKEKKYRGVNVVFEADDPNAGGNTPNKEAEKANKGGVTGQVSVGNDAKTANDNNANKNGDNKDEGAKGVIQRFIELIKKLINGFLEKARRITGKHKAWLEEAKPKLIDMDCSKVSITVAPYTVVNQNNLSQIIGHAASVINGINASALPSQLTSTKSNTARFIFKDIPNVTGVSKDGGFQEKVRHWMIYNNTNASDVKLSTYSGGAASRKIREMVNYCEGYEQFSKDLQADLDELNDAAAKKQEEINNSGKKPEQQTAQQTNDAEKQTTTTVITKVVEEFVRATLTITEAKYYDFMDKLQKLAPDVKKPKEEENADNGDNGKKEEPKNDENKG